MTESSFNDQVDTALDDQGQPQTPLGEAIVGVADALSGAVNPAPQTAVDQPAADDAPADAAPPAEAAPAGDVFTGPQQATENQAASVDVFENAQHATEVQAGLRPDPTAVAPATEEAPTAPPDVEATPAAIAHAEETGVDLTQVEGTGAEGRITKSDVAAAASDSESA